MNSRIKEYFKNLSNRRFLLPIFVMIGVQTITYLIVKIFQTNYHVFNFELDNKIPFIPQAAIIYNLFYPVVFFSFYSIFNKDKDVFYKGIIAGTLGFLIADIIYLVFPVEIIRPDITNLDINPISNFILNATYHLDSPAINCFPSIHCIFCFNAIYNLLITKNYGKLHKTIYIAILIMIIISTLLVKQHYVIDVLAALGIVIITNIIASVIYRKMKHSPSC